MALLPFSFSAENTLLTLNLFLRFTFTLSATDAKQRNVSKHTTKKYYFYNSILIYINSK